MKKIMILAASAALVLAGCAKMQTIETNEVDSPVGFAAYTGQNLTKAGAYDAIDTEKLKTHGFGVFAYQTTGDYSASATPNFMYNTKVSTASWTYSPIKYWPNTIAGTTETGAKTDGDNAKGYHADKVSFFAYAPHVDATAATGAVTPTEEGIIALTTNIQEGDPKVTYKVSTDLNKQVDLLWAVYNSDDVWTNVAGGTNTPTKGYPYLNLQKPAINTAIHLYFRHALAQLRVRALAAYNQVAAGGTRQNGVKITIEKVELSIPGQYQTAVLNLNNTGVALVDSKPQPKWENPADATDPFSLEISGENINAKLKDPGTKTTCAAMADAIPGVIYESTSVATYDADVDVIKDGKYYTIIPKTTATTVNVKVTYYVTTDDADLDGDCSRVKNVISQDVTFDNGFAAGTRNTIKMILGISEVKFEAEVSDWETGAEEEVNLPVNKA